MTAEQGSQEPPTTRHVMSYRPNHDRYEWLRHRAYTEHRTMQSIIDDALDQLRAPNTPQKHPQTRTDTILDILAPTRGNHGRCPIFEWPHEETPTDQELQTLATTILNALNGDQP